MKKGNKVVFVGSTGFPKGLAEVSKQMLISKAFIYTGAEVTIVCNKTGSNIKRTAPDKKGVFEGINYLYTSLISYNPENKIIRKINKIIGVFNETTYLFFHKYDVILINSRTFSDILRYCIIAKITGKKSFLIIVEDPNEMDNAKLISGKLNNKLFNKFAWKMVNAAFPISEFLIKKVQNSNPNITILKIPTLVDLEMFKRIRRNNDRGQYFLFCGAASYFEIVKFIIDSYNLLNNETYKLYLVTNGNNDDVQKIDNEIEKSPKKHLIKRFNYLKYEYLISLYKGASALLVPLRNNKRDIARFPHKIGEYTASGNPIISTNYGEVKFYFTNLENALLAEEYNCEKYCEQMKFVINNPIRSGKIGENGKKLAEREFDYKIFGGRIIKLLN